MTTEFARPVELKPAERPALSALQPIVPPVVKEIAQAAPKQSTCVQAPAIVGSCGGPALKSPPCANKALEASSALSQRFAPLALVTPARIERNSYARHLPSLPMSRSSVPPAIEKVAVRKVEKEFSANARVRPRRTEPRSGSRQTPLPLPRLPAPQRDSDAQVTSAGRRIMHCRHAPIRVRSTWRLIPATPPQNQSGQHQRERQLVRAKALGRTAIPSSRRRHHQKEMEKAFDKA